MRKTFLALGLVALFAVGPIASHADDGLRLVALTAARITTALGYTPANPAASNTWSAQQSFAGQIAMANATSNTFYFGAAGTGAPGTAGEKIQLFGSPGSTTANDYSVGVNGGELWLDSGGVFNFYSNGTKVASITANSAVGLIPTTVASLPTCNATTKDTIQVVSDATAPTYRGTLVGGGAVHTLAECDGASWTSH